MDTLKVLFKSFVLKMINSIFERELEKWKYHPKIRYPTLSLLKSETQRLLTFKTKNIKMKKYFMKETQEELEFGDMIELDLIGDEKGKTIHSHLELEFTPAMVDILLEEGVIEEKETDKNPLDFIMKYQDELNDRIKELEEENKQLKDRVKRLIAKTKTKK